MKLPEFFLSRRAFIIKLLGRLLISSVVKCENQKNHLNWV